MSYSSKRGRRPNEYASKVAHGHIINDPEVQSFLKKCTFPKKAEEISFENHQKLQFETVNHNPIRQIIAIDGGYSEVNVRTEFPSSTMCFFQFGALIFSVSDLEGLEAQPFIDPTDIEKLKQIQRLKLTLPIRNLTLETDSSLTHSIRRAIYEFFHIKIENGRLIDTLRWFIFKEYDKPSSTWVLASCPHCEQNRISLNRSQMTNKHTFACDQCGDEIYLTDIFRLHEVIDDELGAGGILGYVTTTIEQILLVHLIRMILRSKPSILDELLFIKDGPLAFFGQTANMFKPMRELVGFLFENHNLYLAGLEKSGAFVDHADEIGDILENGRILILDNDYIYKYILPGKADPANPYGRTTYYSNKVIFKTSQADIHVISLPTSELLVYPSEGHLKNLYPILENIQKLRCDMYDSALVPVALVNKLVSLANHPSSRILQKFAVESVNRN